MLVQQEQIVRSFIEAVYLNSNIEAIREMVDPQCIYHRNNDLEQGADSIKLSHIYRMINQDRLFEDIRYQIDAVTQDGDQIVVRLKRLSKSRAVVRQQKEKSHENIVFKRMAFKVRDGKIVELWEKTDVTVDIYSSLATT